MASKTDRSNIDVGEDRSKCADTNTNSMNISADGVEENAVNMNESMENDTESVRSNMCWIISNIAYYLLFLC